MLLLRGSQAALELPRLFFRDGVLWLEATVGSALATQLGYQARYL